MKTNFRLMVVTITLLCASLSGCLGGDDGDSEDYSGPIDLVVYYDTTSGMIEISQNNNGGPGTNDGVELKFEFAETTSDDGKITKITLDPDDGSSIVEGDPADNAELSYIWLTHGVFDVILGAEDEAGNTHSIMVKVRIDMHIVWTDQNTGSSSMQIDATPDCADGTPLPERITFTSEAANQQDSFITGAGPSDVTWTFNNPDGDEIWSDSENIPDGGSETRDYSTMDTAAGIWTLNVDVADNGNDINVTNDVTIAYAEGSEDPTNPR